MEVAPGILTVILMIAMMDYNVKDRSLKANHNIHRIFRPAIMMLKIVNCYSAPEVPPLVIAA
jgi:hypothetical protein